MSCKSDRDMVVFVLKEYLSITGRIVSEGLVW